MTCPIQLHKQLTTKFQKRLGLTDYQMLWVAGVKGIIFGFVIAQFF